MNLINYTLIGLTLQYYNLDAECRWTSFLFRMHFLLVQTKWWTESEYFAAVFTMVWTSETGMDVWMLLKFKIEISQLVRASLETKRICGIHQKTNFVATTFAARGALETFLPLLIVSLLVFSQRFPVGRNVTTNRTFLRSLYMPQHMPLQRVAVL